VVFICKLYYTHPWLQELDTKILSHHNEDDQHLVVLEETIFHPTGGGQPHDLGTINGVALLDVFEKDGVILHRLEQALQGDSAFCVLDWPRRLDHMQQHSGQHLLSSVFHDTLGYRTESFHLGEEYCSIDISTPVLSAEVHRKVEARVNELIFSSRPVLTYTLRPEEYKKVPLRKIPNRAGDLRIVEIEGLDYSPCSGTHVASTAQIGLVKLVKVEKYKGMTRVYFLCGNRALRDYGRKHQICQDLGSQLSVPETELSARLALELEQKRELEQQLHRLRGELMNFRAGEIVAQGRSPFFLNVPGASIEEGQMLARSILALTNAVVVMDLGERLLLAHNLKTGLDLGQLVKEHAQSLGGKGGGSAGTAQVFFADPSQRSRFLDLLQVLLIGD